MPYSGKLCQGFNLAIWRIWYKSSIACPPMAVGTQIANGEPFLFNAHQSYQLKL